MLDKYFLDSFLRMNHTSEQMSEGEVRSVMEKAGWPPQEIEQALVLLSRGDAEGGAETPQTENHTQTFRPDMEFSSRELSNLLGVDIELDPAMLAETKTLEGSLKEMGIKMLLGTVVVLISLSIAIGLALATAHYMGVELPQSHEILK